MPRRRLSPGLTERARIRKDAGEDVVTTFGNVAITERDVAKMRDRNKSPEELLREIRHELREDGPVAQGQGPTVGDGGNRGTVSKSETVLKEEDVEDILANFRKDTGVSLADPGGVETFREWLEERVHGDGPGGGPKEQEVLEGIADSIAELEERVRERVAEAEESAA